MSEEQINQADANDGVDKLFRSTLEGYHVEPSKSIWKGISRKLLWAELARFNFINVPKAFWVGAAGVVLVGMIFLFTPIPHEKINGNDNTPVVSKNSTTGKQATAFPKTHVINNKYTSSATQVKPASGGARMVTSRPNPVTNPGLTSLTSTNPTRNTNRSTQDIASAVPAHKGISFITGAENTMPEEKLIISQDRITNNYQLTYLPILNNYNLYPSGTSDTLLRITNLEGITNIPIKSKVKIPQFYSVNLGVSPEISIYNSTDQYSETNYWLNAGMTYHVGKFSIQTGVGLGYVFDKGNYRVNYKSKDSIGYFTSIISFIINPGNIIVYTTKDIPVYDSLQHIADDRAISRYTYLQIPLMLGYELFETNRFSLGVKAGPVLSFLIGTKEAAPFIDYPNARLIRVDNNSLSRVKMNWEIQAVLDLDYRLTKNFSVYAQPYYKHYFKPFVTGESTSVKAKDPYAIGIEIGARFNFGQKSSNP